MTEHHEMTRVALLRPPAADPAPGADRYVPGVCNIGPWEIRRRRAFGIAGMFAAGVLLAVLVGVGAPTSARLVVLLPLWGGLVSWLHARRRFCVGFAWSGLANFAGSDAGRRRIEDPAARRADLRAAARLVADAFLIALPLALLATLLPR